MEGGARHAAWEVPISGQGLIRKEGIRMGHRCHLGKPLWQRLGGKGVGRGQEVQDPHSTIDGEQDEPVLSSDLGEEVRWDRAQRNAWGSRS